MLFSKTFYWNQKVAHQLRGYHIPIHTNQRLHLESGGGGSLYSKEKNAAQCGENCETYKRLKLKETQDVVARRHSRHFFGANLAVPSCAAHKRTTTYKFGVASQNAPFRLVELATSCGAKTRTVGFSVANVAGEADNFEEPLLLPCSKRNSLQVAARQAGQLGGRYHLEAALHARRALNFRQRPCLEARRLRGWEVCSQLRTITIETF